MFDRGLPQLHGLPCRLAEQVVREVYILYPEGKNDGSVGLLSVRAPNGSWLEFLSARGNDEE